MGGINRGGAGRIAVIGQRDGGREFAVRESAGLPMDERDSSMRTQCIRERSIRRLSDLLENEGIAKSQGGIGDRERS